MLWRSSAGVRCATSGASTNHRLAAQPAVGLELRLLLGRLVRLALLLVGRQDVWVPLRRRVGGGVGVHVGRRRRGRRWRRRDREASCRPRRAPAARSNRCRHLGRRLRRSLRRRAPLCRRPLAARRGVVRRRQKLQGRRHRRRLWQARHRLWRQREGWRRRRRLCNARRRRLRQGWRRRRRLRQDWRRRRRLRHRWRRTFRECGGAELEERQRRVLVHGGWTRRDRPSKCKSAWALKATTEAAHIKLAKHKTYTKATPLLAMFIAPPTPPTRKRLLFDVHRAPLVPHR